MLAVPPDAMVTELPVPAAPFTETMPTVAAPPDEVEAARVKLSDALPLFDTTNVCEYVIAPVVGTRSKVPASGDTATAAATAGFSTVVNESLPPGVVSGRRRDVALSDRLIGVPPC